MRVGLFADGVLYFILCSRAHPQCMLPLCVPSLRFRDRCKRILAEPCACDILRSSLYCCFRAPNRPNLLHHAQRTRCQRFATASCSSSPPSSSISRSDSRSVAFGGDASQLCIRSAAAAAGLAARMARQMAQLLRLRSCRAPRIEKSRFATACRCAQFANLFGSRASVRDRESDDRESTSFSFQLENSAFFQLLNDINSAYPVTITQVTITLRVTHKRDRISTLFARNHNEPSIGASRSIVAHRWPPSIRAALAKRSPVARHSCAFTSSVGRAWRGR